MSGQGPAQLFVYYQKPYKINEQGEPEELKQQPHEFIVTDGKFTIAQCDLIHLAGFEPPILTVCQSIHSNNQNVIKSGDLGLNFN